MPGNVSFVLVGLRDKERFARNYSRACIPGDGCAGGIVLAAACAGKR